MDSAQVFLDDERGGVFQLGPVVFMDWRHKSDTAPLAAADRAVEAALTSLPSTSATTPPRRLMYVHRVGPDSPIGRATPEVRNAALAHFERTDLHVVAAAIALESTGFAASVIRSAAAGVLLLRPTPIKVHVFDDAAAGLYWVADQGGARFDVAAALHAFARHGLVKGL
ncbi:MAG TPA: hypothetical protein VGF99_10225 [Myxococcota bacterium]